MFRPSLLSLLLSVALALPACAQANQKEAAKPAEPPAVTEFNQLFAELQKVSESLDQIRQQHRLATPAERPALEAKFKETAQRGQSLYPKLLPAAEKALAADPKMDKDHVQHLLGAAQQHLRGGNSKEAARVFALLIDHKIDEPQLRTLAALASLGAGDEKSAAEHAKKAGTDSKSAEEANKVLREIEFRAADAKAGDLPRVKLQTSKGDITIELFEDQAPNTVANFLSLVGKGFYDGLVFHRVLDGFMAQGGDPTGTGSGGPGYTIPCECYDKNHRHHFFGTLSMAHAGRDTGGSQFFLTFGPTSHLDGKHTAFGRVIEGGEVLAKLQRINPEEATDVKPDKIVKATIVRKRDHEYTPKTLPERKRGPN
jgi:cyclophilin family peptidyl-prolyl cis-trans isomerase